MSEPVDPSPALATTPPAAARTARTHRAWQIVVLLALASAIAAVWLDGRNARLALRTDVAKRLAALEITDKTTLSSVKEAQDNLREAQAKITLLESRLAESQSQQAALEALYRELAPSRDEWALTEIEQVLLLASQQLQLSGNVSSALAAMQLADSKLQRLDRPQFVPLRRALGRDMDRLKAVPFVDVAGLALRLDQAIAGVDALPLALEERVPAPPPQAPLPDDSAWRRFLRGVWLDFRQLVRVENIDRPEAPLLTPQQQFFLRENLKLRLLSARFDLLFRDQPNFRRDLAAADAWLRKYFDTQAAPVQSVLAIVKQVQATDIASDLPDVGRSLEAVHLLQLARDKALR
jgi:uroporphyrin-III C-methyltransferase